MVEGIEADLEIDTGINRCIRIPTVKLKIPANFQFHRRDPKMFGIACYFASS